MINAKVKELMESGISVSTAYRKANVGGRNCVDMRVQKLMCDGVGRRQAYRIIKRLDERPQKEAKHEHTNDDYAYSKGEWV